MGVTIFYRGKLRNAADVQPLTEELVDICLSAGWKFQFLDIRDVKPGDQPFYGITFQPHPESESVWMLFNPEGRLQHPFAFMVEDTPGDLPWSFTKTQFAGADTHKAICSLFRYLEKAWFETFEVNDETNYYATGDEHHLRETIGYINDAINVLSEELSAPASASEDAIERDITGILQRFWDRRKPPGWKGAAMEMHEPLVKAGLDSLS